MPKAAESNTDLPDRPSFQEAFQAAKAQHSAAASDGDDEHALDDDEEASTDTDDEADETEDSETADETPDDDKAADKPKVEKGEKGKAAKGKGKETSDLITDEEFTALQTKHKDDPAALRKDLVGVFTRKTQALAEEKKSVERLRSYSDIIDAYESDPEATIKALAKQHNIDLTPAKAGETETTEETEDAVEQVLSEFKEALGPDLEYLADGLAPAITKLVERLTATTVEKATAPLKKGQETLLTKAATEQTETVMKTFGEKHPDWEEHEPAMLELSKKLQPNGMGEVEYLETLYALVTRDTSTEATKKQTEKQIADGVKAALKKMEQGATNTDTKTRHTPDGQVTTGPPNGRAPSFSEAFAAAKRGERWD